MNKNVSNIVNLKPFAADFMICLLLMDDKLLTKFRLRKITQSSTRLIIIGDNNVVKPENAVEMFRQTQYDGLMIFLKRGEA